MTDLPRRLFLPFAHASQMDICAFVRTREGVLPTHVVEKAGYSRHTIATTVRRGALIRVRQGWLAHPDADPLLIWAARRGVVLTCITQARRHDLWVLDDSMPHVGAPPHAGRIEAPNSHVHWEKPVIPRDPTSKEDPLENVLAIVASCQPFETALAIWNSAIRRRLVEPETLRLLPLPHDRRQLLDEITHFADSGLESMVVPRLRWLKLPLRRQIWLAGHRVDLLIGDRLVLQIDGGHHVGAQRAQDIAHDARLVVMGFHVIRVTYGQIIDHWPSTQETIMRAVAQGLHRPPARRRP